MEPSVLNYLSGHLDEVIFITDAKGNWSYLNSAWEKITGFNVNDSLGTNILTYIHPEEKAKTKRLFNSLKGKKEQFIDYEFRCLSRDSSIKWLKVVVSPMFRNGQGFIGTQGILNDITEEKSIPNSLVAREALFEKYFDLSIMGIAIVSPSKNWLEVNNKLCEILGYRKDELLKYTWQDITHPKDIKVGEFDFNKMLSGVIEGYSIQKRFIHKFGTIVYTQIDVKCVRHADGSIDFIIFLIQDITEQKKNEEKIRSLNEQLEQKVLERTKEVNRTFEQLKAAQGQLVHSEKMASLGVLTAGIAHELNNPINYIKSGMVGLRTLMKHVLTIVEEYDKIDDENFEMQLEKVQQLKEELAFKERIELSKRVLEDIHLGTTRSTEIVKGLQIFSKNNEDVCGIVDIHDGINATILLLQYQINNRVEVIKNFGDVPKITCYPGKLNQAFMNIMTNSIQAIKENGSITITTGEFGDWVYIDFKDTGVGMSEATKQKVFEPFFTTKEVGKGTGLGLSIVLGIIESHQGKIEVESKIGEGASFKIFLPKI